MSVKKTHDEFLTDLKKKNNKVTILGTYKGVASKILCECNICRHNWTPTPNSLLNGYGCPVCSHSYMNNTLFTIKLSKINDKIKPLEEYVTAKTKITCLCLKCEHKWKVIPDSLLHGTGCPICGIKKLSNSQRKTEEQFLTEMYKINSNIKITSKYITARKPITYECTLHNYHSSSTPDNLLRKFGCPICAGNQRTKESFYSDVLRLNSNIEFMSEFKTVNDYMKCKCKKCGNLWDVKASHLLEGCGCPICNVSKGEERILSFLTSNNIFFEPHKKYKDLLGTGGRNLSYDFFLPNYNLLIEYQGKQHRQAYQYFGGEKRLKKQMIHDSLKREYARLHNIILLEIWYFDFNNIENILNEKLKNLLYQECYCKDYSNE